MVSSLKMEDRICDLTLAQRFQALIIISRRHPAVMVEAMARIRRGKKDIKVHSWQIRGMEREDPDAGSYEIIS